MIETIELPEMIAIGVLVEASGDDLPKAIPAAWTRLFETDTGATSFLEVSISREHGVYRELVGYLAAKKTEVPAGMTRIVIPAQRYLRIIHDGPLAEIAAGFEQLYAHAALAELRATDYKLDFGYAPGLPPGRHELHVALEPETLKLT
jgi:predicted transcriptional regulator YdeE